MIDLIDSDKLTALLFTHRRSDSVTPMSYQTVTGGYLLVVKFCWSLGDWTEDAIFITKIPKGIKAGEWRIGWTHLIAEYIAE